MAASAASEAILLRCMAIGTRLPPLELLKDRLKIGASKLLEAPDGDRYTTRRAAARAAARAARSTGRVPVPRRARAGDLRRQGQVDPQAGRQPLLEPGGLWHDRPD